LWLTPAEQASHGVAPRTACQLAVRGACGEWSVKSSLSQRDPDPEEPESPSALVWREYWNCIEAVVVEGLMIEPRLIDVARRSIPMPVPATRGRRPVPAARRGRSIPARGRTAGRRTVVPPVLTRWWSLRRALARPTPIVGLVVRASAGTAGSTRTAGAAVLLVARRIGERRRYRN
jgi:hypothetical protein